MGRTTQTSRGIALPSRDVRAKKAKLTINKTIPSLLKAYPRAQAGIDASELLVESEIHRRLHVITGSALPPSHVKQTEPLLPQQCQIRIRCTDTLRAARDLNESSIHKHSQRTNVAVLSLASPLRPGGGFLNGATSQEESLCMRTTLLPALKEEFYRLPEIGGIYTPDVLVFRSADVEASDLLKQERFFVNIITAAMHRMPEIDVDDSGEQRYTNVGDRISAEAKISAVMEIAVIKKIKRLVLGAWGCGAYGNPVSEIAMAFRKVLRDSTSTNPRWAGIEIIFAIKDRLIAQSFAHCFDVEIEEDEQPDEADKENSDEQDDEVSQKILQLQEQISTTRSDVLKQRLMEALKRLQEYQHD